MHLSLNHQVVTNHQGTLRRMSGREDLTSLEVENLHHPLLGEVVMVVVAVAEEVLLVIHMRTCGVGNPLHPSQELQKKVRKSEFKASLVLQGSETGL